MHFGTLRYSRGRGRPFQFRLRVVQTVGGVDECLGIVALRRFDLNCVEVCDLAHGGEHVGPRFVTGRRYLRHYLAGPGAVLLVQAGTDGLGPISRGALARDRKVLDAGRLSLYLR